MVQKNEDFQKKWAKVVAKAWSDPAFKKRLLENPKETLESNGLKLSPGTKLVVNENTKNTLYLTLPEKPQGELLEENLLDIAAGGCSCTIHHSL